MDSRSGRSVLPGAGLGQPLAAAPEVQRQRLRVQFRERLIQTIGNEDGVIAKALLAARRESQLAMYLAFKGP